MKSIEFYREDGQWYADIPNHTKEENEMVAGADIFLDFVSYHLCCHHDRIIIMVSDDNEGGRFDMKLIRKHHDDAGATYVVTGEMAKMIHCEGQELWLCNVAHDVFGDHPESIYIHSIDSTDILESVVRENDLKTRSYNYLLKRGFPFPEKIYDYNVEDYRKLYEKMFYEFADYIGSVLMSKKER